MLLAVVWWARVEKHSRRHAISALQLSDDVLTIQTPARLDC